MKTDLKDYIKQRREVMVKIEEIIRRRISDQARIDPDTNLFGTGLGLDSVDIIDIIVDIENEFGKGLFVDDRELMVEHMRSLNTVTDHVLASIEAGDKND